MALTFDCCDQVWIRKPKLAFFICFIQIVFPNCWKTSWEILTKIMFIYVFIMHNSAVLRQKLISTGPMICKALTFNLSPSHWQHMTTWWHMSVINFIQTNSSYADLLFIKNNTYVWHFTILSKYFHTFTFNGVLLHCGTNTLLQYVMRWVFQGVTMV